MSPPLRQQSAARRSRGFTLLEMLIAIMVFVLLITGIFAIANGSLELSSDLTYAQERALMRQNLIEFLRKSFRTLPGDAEIELRVRNAGGTYLPTLAVYSGGSSFSPGPALPMEASMEVYAQERPGGYLRAGLRALDAEQTAAARQNREVKAAPSAELPLLDNVARFEWRFFNGRTNQWENVWKGQVQGRPLFAELSLQLDDGEESRSVFWIPPVRRPQISGIPSMQPGMGQPGATVSDPNAPPGAPQQPGIVPQPQIIPQQR